MGVAHARKKTIKTHLPARLSASNQRYSVDMPVLISFQILLFTSTFSSQLIFTLLLPMLAIVSESCQSFYQSLRLSAERSLTGIGEVRLAQHQTEAEDMLKQLTYIYLTAHLIKVMCLYTVTLKY